MIETWRDIIAIRSFFSREFSSKLLLVSPDDRGDCWLPVFLKLSIVMPVGCGWLILPSLAVEEGCRVHERAVGRLLLNVPIDSIKHRNKATDGFDGFRPCLAS